MHYASLFLYVCSKNQGEKTKNSSPKALKIFFKKTPQYSCKVIKILSNNFVHSKRFENCKILYIMGNSQKRYFPANPVPPDRRKILKKPALCQGNMA